MGVSRASNARSDDTALYPPGAAPPAQASIEYDATGQPKDHTGRPKGRLRELGFECTSIHHAADPVQAVRDAKALFVGGGNGFRLLKELYKHEGLVEARGGGKKRPRLRLSLRGSAPPLCPGV